MVSRGAVPVRCGMRTTLAIGLALSLTLGLTITCSSDPDDEWEEYEEDGEEDYYDNDELGLEIDEFEWADPPSAMNDEGYEEFEEDAEVTIEGMGEHIVLVEYWEEIEDDGSATNVEILVVTDKTLNQVREYRFDPSATSFGIGEADGANEVEVIKNPDGSYTVDGVAAANGKAAVALLKGHPVYADASAWGVITAYAVCQTCLERAAKRTPMCCNCDGGGPSSDEVAVCDVFPDLCACIACDKLNKPGCSLCP